MKDSQRVGTKERAKEIIKALKKAVRGLPKPAATKITEKYGRDPFLALISCILSLRTRDITSYPASVRLFTKAKTPKSMLKLTQAQIQKLIYPVGFYRQKAKQIHEICTILLGKYKGKVPDSHEELMALPGVGPKTAALVLAEAFKIPAICVDTHVHRLCNKPHFGIVNTKTVEETEAALEKIIPKKNWRDFNRLVVTWGQNVCKPNMPCQCKKLFF